VFRGGCWGYSPYYCRSAYRDSFAPSYRNNDVLGFRVARSQSV
jgi:formylglycine-generating enzyme required for sulfatase activity